MGRLLEIAKAVLRQRGAKHAGDASVPATQPMPLTPYTVQTPVYAAPLDPLYTGALTGKVPAGWSHDGWIDSVRDRMKRTNDPLVLGMLKRELSAIVANGVTEEAKH